MLKIYTAYECKKCSKEFVLLTEELQNFKGYLICPYCSNIKVRKEKITDDLRECMEERSYHRNKHGAIVQR